MTHLSISKLLSSISLPCFCTFASFDFSLYSLNTPFLPYLPSPLLIFSLFLFPFLLLHTLSSTYFHSQPYISLFPSPLYLPVPPLPLFSSLFVQHLLRLSNTFFFIQERKHPKMLSSFKRSPSRRCSVSNEILSPSHSFGKSKLLKSPGDNSFIRIEEVDPTDINVKIEEVPLTIPKFNHTAKGKLAKTHGKNIMNSGKGKNGGEKQTGNLKLLQKKQILNKGILFPIIVLWLID